jgi:hypothetical protein
MNLLDLIAGPIASLIEKYVPSAEDRARLNLEILQVQQSAEFKQIDAAIALGQQQSDVNKVEAASTRLFIAGWRPFVGWVCGSGLAMSTIVSPLLTWISAVCGHPTNFPKLDDPLLQSTLAGMLGLGFGLRTVEKLQGKA